MKRIVYFLPLIVSFYTCQTPNSQVFENTCWEGEGVILVLQDNHRATLNTPPYVTADTTIYTLNLDGEWEYVEKSFRKEMNIWGHPQCYTFGVRTSLISKKPKYLYYFEGDPDEYNIHKLYPVSCCSEFQDYEKSICF